VSKQVGGAVTRNTVKRRLRALAKAQLVDNPTGWDVIVRALPAAATAPFEDLEKSWRDGFTRALAQ
jgi:ribonuclease P protein component